MDYGNVLDDALTYTKTGIFGRTDRWMKLILAIICVGIPMNGYVMRIYRGTQPAPDVDQWGTLFVDGLKLMIVGCIYAIPMLIIWIFAYGGMLMGAISGSMTPSAVENWSPNLALILLMYIFEIIIAIILPVASIRFARTNRFSEAFNFTEIIDTIKKIGWINYIVAIVLIAVVIGIPICIIIFGFLLIAVISILMLGGSNMAILGFILAAILIILVLAPIFAVFQARYMTRVYDSAEEKV
jgi:hypothetical protein